MSNAYARLSLNDVDDPRSPIIDEDSDAREVKTPLRPHIYYDDGPFNAPSSESEDETLLEKDASSRDEASPRSLGIAETGIPADGRFRGTGVCCVLNLHSSV